MQTPPKRPISVWIAQIIFLLLASVWLIGLGLVLLAPLPMGSGGPQLLVGYLFAILTTAALCFLVLAAFWGLWKRRRWGRWLSVGILSFLLAMSTLNSLITGTGGGSSAYVGGYFFGAFTVLFLFGFLIFRLAFGDAAADFFAEQESEPGSVSDPPPPPSFGS